MDNYQQNDQLLPPLPASDEQSISWNRSDSFYGVRSRDFWSKNHITSNKVDEYKKCNHFFVRKSQGVECQTCHIGFFGYFEIQDGKLFYKGEPLGI